MPPTEAIPLDIVPNDVAQIMNTLGVAMEEDDARPDRALVAFGYCQGEFRGDKPVILDGTEDVLTRAYRGNACSAIALGIIPDVPHWNNGNYFTHRPTGLMVWEGDIDNPMSNFAWRRLLPEEMEKVCLGHPIWTSSSAPYLRRRGRYTKDQYVELSTDWQTRADDRRS